MSPIALPKLEEARLSSNIQGVAPTLLSIIRVPSSIRKLTVIHKDVGPDSDSAVEAVIPRLGQACSEIPGPRYLTVTRPDGRFQVPEGFELTALQDSPGANALNTVPQNSQVVTVVSLHTPPPWAPEFRDASLPSPNPEHWAFCNVQEIKIEHVLPVTFWKALSRIPTLVKLEYWVTQGDVGFLEALGERVDWKGDSGRCEPFSSLRVVWARFQAMDSEHEVEYARNLAAVLDETRGMGSTHLESLKFIGCVTVVDEDTLHLLRSAAAEVLWD
ncbi:hypothetical protein D9611_000636 [Ephemerocybe angulata]|uniref:Uncharacterized protein n=1 Tax=Ephemerocybe angulata TaxID=980116 RepID=A0A8H5BNL9_9AGAR|nr:hypothetical protein D9611_000636 [Tulosesus angulatus]